MQTSSSIPTVLAKGKKFAATYTAGGLLRKGQNGPCDKTRFKKISITQISDWHHEKNSLQ